MKKVLVITFLLLPIFFLSVPRQSQAVCSRCLQSTSSSLLKPNKVATYQATPNNTDDIYNPTATSSSLVILQTLREKLKERKEVLKAEFKEAKATFKEVISQAKKSAIKIHFKRMIDKYEAAINRLETLILRIESRLAKIEATNNNIDTSGIRNEIISAKENLTQAKSALSEAQQSFETILNGETPQEDFTQVAKLLKQIKLSLIEVHGQLVKVIGNIKGLRVGNSPSLSITETREASEASQETEIE